MVRREGGFTLLEVVIATFVAAVVMVGMMGLFILTLRSSQEGEYRVLAVALANERMEQVRNLPYLDVGTVGGVPAGTIEQSVDVVRGDVTYTVDTDIRYVDDEFDNPGDALSSDYKQVRVQVSWTTRQEARPITLITYVVPAGLEGGEEGGTLDLHVINSLGEDVANANVTLQNDSVDPVIDLNTQTNSEGRLVLPGLPESSESYEISVTKTGYSSEQTYDTTSTFFPYPQYTHATILQGEITEKTFIIDDVAELSTSWFEMPEPVGYWKFDESAGLTAADSSEYGNDGSLTNMSGDEWDADEKATLNFENVGSLEFDGENDYVDLGDPSSGIFDMDQDDSFALGAWVRTDVVPPVNQPFLFMAYACTSEHWGLYLMDDGTTQLSVRDNLGNYPLIQGGVDVVDGEWHHVFGVRDTVEDKVKLYVDGELEAETEDTTTGDFTVEGAQNYIGSHGLCGEQTYFDGHIDDVRIYNEALSDEAVSVLAGGDEPIDVALSESLDYTITSAKAIGEDDEANVVYKTDESVATEADGTYVHEDLEPDVYDVTIDGEETGYSIKEASVPLPIAINPGDVIDLMLKLTTYSVRSLWVTVVDVGGSPIVGANVEVTAPVSLPAQGTEEYGQVYFGNLATDDDYTLSVSADGYVDASIEARVEGVSRVTIEMTSE